MEDIKKWLISWPVIVITFIVFWPMGFVLIYIRSVMKNGKLKTKGITLIIVAVCCYSIALVGSASTVDDPTNDLMVGIVMIIMFLIGGIVSTVFAVKSLKKYNQYKKYVEKIGARVKVPINEIAQQMGETIETTMKNIYEIIKYKMLDAYINEDNEIVIKTNVEYDSFNVIEAKKEIITVQCKNCGATNKFIVGKENRCEFCDTVLKNYSK